MMRYIVGSGISTHIVCAFVLPLLLLQCKVDDSPFVGDELTWEQFLESGLALPYGDGKWIVEGDLSIDNEALLRRYYEERHGPERAEPRAFVERVAGNDQILDVARKLNISYCVSDGFGATTKADLITRLHDATLSWERAGDVNFIYRELGANCVPGSPDVYFTVIKVPDHDSVCASGSFPGSTTVTLEITPHGLGGTCSSPGGYLLRHELGHILGLQHEHIRGWESCGQPSADDPHLLTEIDYRSVMGYFDLFDETTGGESDCPNFQPWRLISRRDVAGFKFLYSLPKGNWLGRNGSTTFQHGPRFNTDLPHDIFWYTPATAVEVLQLGSATGMTSLAVTSEAGVRHKPIVGRFSADSLSDVLFYSPFTEQDRLYVTGSPAGAFTLSNRTISGFHVPIVGHFSTTTPSTGLTDVYLYGPGAGNDILLRANGLASVFTEVDVTDVGTSTDDLIPIAGDYDGDGDTDVYFYHSDNATTNHPSILMKTSAAVPFIFTDHNHWSFGIEGNEAAVFFYSWVTGDFDGSGNHDIFWYAPGQTVSGRFWKGALVNPLTTTQTANQSSTERFKIFAGRFDNNATTDIFWYNQDGGLDQVWLMNGSFGHTTVNIDLDSTEYNLVLGDYTGDGLTDLYLHDPNGSDKLLGSDGDGTFTTIQTLTGPSNAYPVGFGSG